MEINTEHQRPRWLHFFMVNSTLLEEYVKSHGLKASDVMTPAVITVSPDTKLADIAEILETRHIKRVPVMENDQLVGIVSRANLIQALATHRHEPEQPSSVSDDMIRGSLLSEIERMAWIPYMIVNTVTVHEGVVHLWGFVNSEAERKAVLIAAQGILGVREVKDHRTDPLPAAIF